MLPVCGEVGSVGAPTRSRTSEAMLIPNGEPKP